MTQFEVYKLIFTAELVVSEGMFMYRFRRRKLFPLRLILCLAVCFAFSFFFPVVYNAAYASFLFFSLFVMTLLSAIICFDERVFEIIFGAIAAYSVQHIAYEFYGFIIAVTGLGNDPNELYANTSFTFGDAYGVIIYFVVYSTVYLSMFFLFARRMKSKEGDANIKRGNMLALAAVIILIDIILNMIVVYRSYENDDTVYRVVVFVYNIVCCVLALLIQFGLLTRQSLEREVTFIHDMWEKERKQYNFSKESIELINQKCHDIKHQIRRYGNTGALSEGAVKEMEDAISIYDSAIKTDNIALDIILREKLLFCKGNGIEMTCMADGSGLGFMPDTEIYSLFGNLLDNAIEASLKLPKEKRVIGLVVSRDKDLLVINAYNYYAEKPVFENGAPVTSKGDTARHGYGLKSINMIAEKYGGNVSITADEGVFEVNILFPLGEKHESERNNGKSVPKRRTNIKSIIKYALPFVIVAFVALIAFVIVVNAEIWVTRY